MSIRSGVWTSALLAILVAGVAFVSAQPRTRAATLDDLLTELRALRADMNRTAGATTQVQILVARATLQERRLKALSRQYTQAQDDLAKAKGMRSAEEERLEQFEDGSANGRIPPGVPIQEVETLIASLRDQELPQLRERERALSRRVDELSGYLAREESRWAELNGRLDEIEAQPQPRSGDGTFSGRGYPRT